MNPRWLLLVGLLVSSSFLPSRASAELKWELGFKGGLALARVSGDTEISETLSDPDLGTVVIRGDAGSFQGAGVGGAYARAQFSPRFGLQMEFLFAEKGGRGETDVSIDGNSVDSGVATYRFSYIEFPLLAVGSFELGERTSVDVFGGPAFAYNTSGRVLLEYEDDEIEQNLSDDLSSTDIGLSLGASFNLLTKGDVDLHFGARFTLGLVDVPDSDLSFKNQYFSFMFGIGFPIRTDEEEEELP